MTVRKLKPEILLKICSEMSGFQVGDFKYVQNEINFTDYYENQFAIRIREVESTKTIFFCVCVCHNLPLNQKKNF